MPASAETLVSMFLVTARAQGAAPALRSKRDGAWVPTSWTEWERRARALAAYLVDVGVEPGDRVAVFGSTRQEWVIADLAVLMAGAVTVPIYPSLIGEQAAYILLDSGTKVLIAEDQAFVQRIADHDAALAARFGGGRTLLFAALPAADPSLDVAAKVDARITEGRADDLATIVYTSGTTGPPKGVMLTHEAITHDVRGLEKAVELEQKDEQLLFLPLAHIFGRMLVAVQYKVGFTTSFAESLLKALDNAVEVNPTFIGCVPRLYEKVYAVANERAAAGGAVKQRLFAWATSGGKAKRRGLGHALADRLVLSKIRARFGTRLRFAISGGAPLAKELSEWFDRAGVLVLEVYGLTEVTGGATVNTPGDYRFGTVGKPVPGVEVKVAPDGEVLIRGPSVMRGYWNKDEDTRAVIDDDGWFHSGDIGELDADGFLRITDRKKDIIVTAGGKNVAPQNIENLLKQSAWVSQAVVHGDKRPYLVALVTLNLETASRFARERGVSPEPEALAAHPEVRAAVQREIDTVNTRLSSFETVKKFTIVARDFSIEGGELTPTLKVKRKVVGERYRDVLVAMYGDS